MRGGAIGWMLAAMNPHARLRPAADPARRARLPGRACPGGLVAAFALVGTPAGIAAAAVLGYRAFQLGVPAILGVTAFARLRRDLDRGVADDSEVTRARPSPLEPATASA